MINIIYTMLEVGAFFGTRQVYQAGGSLQDRPMVDLDLIILTEMTDFITFGMVTEFYRQGHCSSINVYKAYGQGDEEDSKFHTKAVTEMNGVKVDLLFSNISEYPTILDIMKDFPLSIQMQAVGIDGMYYKHSRFSADPIIVYRPECKKSAIEKYKEYYPDTEFIEA